MGETGQSSAKPAKARIVTVKKYSEQANIEAQDKLVIEVDFNPQSLKLNFQNQIEGAKEPKAKGTQYVGSSSSTLNVELLFDSTQAHNTSTAGSDVRKKTKAIADVVLPSKEKKDKVTPPIVRFEWGSFLFEGIVTTMSETLEYFSAQGVPLRATVALTMTRPAVAILIKDLGSAANGAKGTGQSGTPDTKPKSPLPPGDSLQKAAGKTGNSSDWRSVANANGIDNPLRPPIGKPLDLSPDLPQVGVSSLGGNVSSPSITVSGNPALLVSGRPDVRFRR